MKSAKDSCHTDDGVKAEILFINKIILLEQKLSVLMNYFVKMFQLGQSKLL